MLQILIFILANWAVICLTRSVAPTHFHTLIVLYNIRIYKIKCLPTCMDLRNVLVLCKEKLNSVKCHKFVLLCA